MGHLDDISDAVADLFETDEFGDSVIFTPKSGTPSTISIVRGLDMGTEGRGADESGRVDVVGILLSDSPADPTGGRLKIDASPIDKVWRVMKATLHPSRVYWVAEIHGVD